MSYPQRQPTGEVNEWGISIFEYEEGAIDGWYEAYHDSLTYWHSLVEHWTNTVQPDGLSWSNQFPVGTFLPGSEAFSSAFDELTSLKNNEGEGGTRFFDESSLTHVHGEYILKPQGLEEIRMGGNFRRYTPWSDGTIFSDTTERIINQEFGFYAGIKRRFLEDRLIGTATIRADKNQNFDWIYSPAASLVFSPREQDYLRLSYSSAVRNPTLADQYLWLDVGPATLVGNLYGADSLVTLDSFNEYRNSSSATSGQIGFDNSLLSYFDIATLRPEKVQTVEVGYRTTIGEKLYMDGGYYFSSYRDFIGYNIGLDLLFLPGNTGFPNGVDVYRYAANSINEVQTQGASVGLNYYLDNRFMISGNYSWNELVKTDEDDPIIPAFNTPRHKYNLGLTGRDYKLKGKSTWGFGVNYKWIQGFLFEGSPQFTGNVPTYDLLDAQVNAIIEPLNLTVKLGGSNLLQNIHIETYGGPSVGRMLYGSLIYEFNHRKDR